MMDPRERWDDPEEAARAAQEGHQARMWTSLPGIIKKFDPATCTAEVQPVIRGKFTKPDGTVDDVDMPILVDVPVEFPNGGGFILTFPVKAGDECVLDFQARSIDAWHQSGGVQKAGDARMHSLSDAVCRVGPKSKPNVVSNISTTATQLRTKDGGTFVQVEDGTITLKGKVEVIGAMHVTQTVKSDGDVTAGTVSVQKHLHTKVQTGSALSGEPKP